MWVVLIGTIAHSQIITDTDNVIISAQVNGAPPNNGGGGGDNSPTEVKFSGMAYPSSKVFILKDSVVVATTIADPDAKFAVTLSNLASGSYSFSVYGEDDEARKSTAYSFPVFVTSGTTITIGGIFLSPTIDVDKLEVRKGEPIAIFGSSAPNAEVSIVVHSETEHIKRVMTDESGTYFLRFDSAPLEYGNHITKSAAIADTNVSLFSNSAAFRVGENTILKKPGACPLLRGDLNCDGHVNLVDFSIMAFWYKKNSFPEKVDLNGDGAITLVDFSIMAYNWTG